VFLQPTFTWTRVAPDGTVALGVHPMLLGLVGAPYRMHRRDPGDRVAQGEPLLQLGTGAHAIEVRAPFAARILKVNRRVAGESTWDGVAAGNGSWLYRLEPEDLGTEVPTWMVADEAARWSGAQYDRVRTHLMRLAERPDVGVTMADGGDVPIGVLRQLDDAGWVEFAAVFL
jgi:glycine cleavage system H lipoate-binding protein